MIVVQTFYSHPRSMVCLDGYIFDDKSTFGLNCDMPEILPNPTGYCGFPLFLRRYTALTLEQRIKKITSEPALWYGIKGRGVVKEGMYADLNVIDLDELDPCIDHIKAMEYPKGIKDVIVNGKLVVENGVHTGTRSGKVLRRL